MEKITTSIRNRMISCFSKIDVKTSIILVFLNFFFMSAFAQWSYNPTVNTPVCLSAGEQTTIQMVQDGEGGAIMVWVDYRLGYSDLYAQHIDSHGTLLWNPDGVPICLAAADQSEPKITADGYGGAIITWYDTRNANDRDIYAQRINSQGLIQWQIDGVAICTSPGSQSMQQITTDNSGGAIIVWCDARNGGPNADIYVQNINSAGVNQWTGNGVAVCTATYNQGSPSLISDGAGGAIITWSDFRGEWTDIYAQRILSTGVLNWSYYDGVPICMANYHQDMPQIVTDGAGGAIICWQDNRNNYVSGIDTYAQKINPAGLVQWAQDGVAVCNAPYLQAFNQMIPDGTGGAFITWEDRRSYSDIYAQKISTTGLPEWTIDGVPVCVSAPVQKEPHLSMNASGNVVIVWTDDYQNILAQSISPSGSFLWTTDGIPVCNEANVQSYAQIVSDGADSVIIAWQDTRNGNTDIYASKLNSDGILLKVASQPETPFSIFPNPAKDILSISAAPDNFIDEISISDMAGKTVLKSYGTHDQINVSNLPAGLYLVFIHSGKKIEVLKFSKL